jgi:hypothetical protein
VAGEVSPYAIDKYIAQRLSALTEARPRPIGGEFAEYPHWLHNLGLNRIFGAPLDESKARLYSALVRRVRDSIAEFDEGCFFLDLFVKGRALDEYFAALVRFEAAILWLSFAREIAMKTMNVKAFKKGDGSVDERLYWLYCVIKHNDPMTIPPEHTNALWIENDGIYGGQLVAIGEDRRKISFDELRHEIREFAEIADTLAAGEKKP